jgi:hypothetical protein
LEIVLPKATVSVTSKVDSNVTCSQTGRHKVVRQFGAATDGVHCVM